MSKPNVSKEAFGVMACRSEVLEEPPMTASQWVDLRMAMILMGLFGLAALPACGRSEALPEVAVEPSAPSVQAEEPALEEDALRAALGDEFVGAYPLVGETATTVRTVQLRAAPATTSLDGVRNTAVWAYDGTVPGPVLRVRLGEELRVTLDNRLPVATTIHWHGVRVHNAMDGVPGITQEPISPGAQFEYRLVPKDAGTFWYHPHVDGAEQVERGLHGVLVVEDRHPLPYSQDVVWMIDDWRLAEDGTIDPNFVTRHDLAHDGRWGQTITVNGRTDTELRVVPGSRIRLRLANPSNGRVYTPDFGPLEPRVVAVDGMFTARPLPLRGFELPPGARLDLDLVVPASTGSF